MCLLLFSWCEAWYIVVITIMWVFCRMVVSYDIYLTVVDTNIYK